MVDVKSYSCFPTMIYEFKGIDKANHFSDRALNDNDYHYFRFQKCVKVFRVE